MRNGNTTARQGSGIPPEIAREIDAWEAEMSRFLAGEISDERWRAFRLGYGIYGQRQPGVQMVRVKIPAGALDGRQLERLADISEEFATGVTHLTTRQDVQFYSIALQRVPDLLRALAEVGLTTREACGNSVRNVTACPLSGFIAEEAFEVQPYALATYAYLVRNPFCQQLARKFKVAFSACPEDCAATAIHDIGALGRVEAIDGRTVYGFKVLVGGGLGAAPMVARVLEEFVPIEELLPTFKAILRVYSQLGNRRNKAKARIKFVVHKQGIERIRELVAEAKAALTAEERAEADLLRYVPKPAEALVRSHLEGRPTLAEIRSARELAAVRPAIWAVAPQGPPPEPGAARAAAPAKGMPSICDGPDHDEGAFLAWQSCSVRPHRDRDRAVVTVLCPLGDLEAPKLRALARTVTALAEDHVRVGREQNLVFPSVRRSRLRELHLRLTALGLAEAGVGTALDVTCCPGADTCQIGITSSKGLTRAIRKEIVPLAAGGAGLEPLRDVTIKISGCPNSCGQHHVANIGFHGVVKSIGGRQAPAYQLHLGGRAAAGQATIGRGLDKIPARNVPATVSALLSLYRDERAGNESLPEFFGRLPEERLRSILKPFVEQLPPEEELHVDWGQDGPFGTDEIGTGECAGAGTDAVVDPFDNYRAELTQTECFMQRGQWIDALANLNRSQYTLARILLEPLGKHPDSDYEVACELRAQVIDRGHAGERWNEQQEEVANALRTKHPSPETVRGLHRRAVVLLEESRATLSILIAKKAAAGSSPEIPG